MAKKQDNKRGSSIRSEDFWPGRVGVCEFKTVLTVLEMISKKREARDHLVFMEQSMAASTIASICHVRIRGHNVFVSEGLFALLLRRQAAGLAWMI